MLKVDRSIKYIEVPKLGTPNLGADFKPIPPHLFSQVINLFIYYSLLKVEVLVYIYAKLISTGYDYVIGVPTQQVSEYRIDVKASGKVLDITTGLELPNLIKLGSIHSHHSMDCVFSTTDDISDFSNPPGLHLLFGNFPNIQLIGSLVANNLRHYISIKDVVKYTESHIYDEPLESIKEIIKYDQN